MSSSTVREAPPLLPINQLLLGGIDRSSQVIRLRLRESVNPYRSLSSPRATELVRAFLEIASRC